MANIGDRPNLKICIDNTEEGSESGDDAAEGAEDVAEEDDGAVESDGDVSGSGAGDKVGSSAAEEDEDIERAILEANIPPEELEELSPDSSPIPASRVKSEQQTERVAPKSQKLNIPRSEKEKLEDADIEAMYESLGFTIAQLEKSNDRGIRLEAIHMRGIEDMEEEDIMQYFSEFEPSSIEWIDDESCNVVWQDPMKAAHAMLKLSILSQIDMSDSESDSQETMDTEETSETKRKDVAAADDELNLLSDEEDKETGEKVPANLVEKRLRGNSQDEQMNVDGDGKKEEKENGELKEKETKSTRTRSRRPKVPPGKWRIGVAHLKAEVLFFRFANKADIPLPGAEHKRKFRRKFAKAVSRMGAEGLMSERKRKEVEEKQNELEIEKAKEALLKKQRPLEDHSIPDFLLEDVPELPEEFAAYPDPITKPDKPKVRELHSKSSMQDKRLRMKRKRSDSDDSPETDVEEELNALLKPKSPKRLPIGRMHADEEEEKLQAMKSRRIEPGHADPTDARSLIVRRRHKRKLVEERRRSRDYDRYEDEDSEDSWEDASDEEEEEEEDHETFGVSVSSIRSRSNRHHDKSRHKGSRSGRSGTSRHSRDNKPNLKDLPSLTIQVEAD